MSVILHLSDLHLGKEQPWERATDDKSDIVPRDENSRLQVMRTALSAVRAHLVAADLDLDAVVIGGDITTAYDEDGFKRFETLLDDLKLADPDRIIAVPGNHDVDRSVDPGLAEKYSRFLKYTRTAGLRTPFCDGVDTLEAADANPIFELDDCVIAAVNSANWCGVGVSSPNGVEHRYDAARVSESQLEFLTDQLRDYEVEGKVRIAALHHHLLPVTEDEETKPFESFTNLARLRSWV